MKKIMVSVIWICMCATFALAADNPVVMIKTSMGNIKAELFMDQAPITVSNFLGLATGKQEFTDVDGKKTKRPYYDGLIFHRVIKNFMIQGGDLTGTGAGGVGYQIPDEINAKALGLDKMMAVPKGRPHKFLGVRSQQEFSQMIIGPMTQKMGIKDDKDFNERKKELIANIEKLTLMGAYENMGYIYNDQLKSTSPVRGVLAMANRGPNTGGGQFFINVIDTPWLAGKHTVFGKVTKGMDVVDKISKVFTNPKQKPEKDVVIESIRLISDHKVTQKKK